MAMISLTHGIRLWLSSLSRFYPSTTTNDEVVNPSPFHPVIQDFQQLIENDATLFMYFTNIFNEIPNYPLHHSDVGNAQIRDYHQMLASLDNVIQSAPPWNDVANAAGFAGCPIHAILKWPMCTPSGHSAFLDPRVNAMLKKIFDVWHRHLISAASTRVLSTEPDGWFGPNAMRALLDMANASHLEGATFSDIYNCDPSKPSFGFKSWDHFFTRTFREGLRPISDPEDDSVIVSPCESAPYRLSRHVSKRERFWVKGQPYSIENMLANDELVPLFVGGTVYQAFLSSLSYHRWHSPISGTVIKSYNIPGTYYSQSFLHTFAGELGPDPGAPMQSQAYITSIAARAVIFIKADNKAIGTVCVMPVGMVEVSSCEITVRRGQRVKKGQEVGMFHFGGSTCCMIFEAGVELEWEKECEPPYSDSTSNVPVCKRIATVHRP